MRRLLPILPVLSLAMATSARADVVVGYLTGPDNIPVTGATLVLSAGAASGQYATQTDAQGFFLFPEVAGGRKYFLSAEADGYSPLRLDAVVLAEKGRTRLSLRMQPAAGSWTQQTQLRSQPPLSALGVHTLPPDAALPLLPRPDVEGLFERLPGAHQEVVLPNYTRQPWRAPAIHGSTGLEQEYRVDGLDLSDPFTGRLAFSFPLPFFERFEAAHAGLSVLDAGNTGSLLALQTGQGGNRVTGDAFLFGLSTLQPTPLQQEYETADRAVLGREDWQLFDGQLSASLGGFLRRDRLWYFGGVAPSGALDRLQSCLSAIAAPEQGCIASLSSSGYGYRYEIPAILRLTFNPTPDQSLQLAGYGSYGESEGYPAPASDGLTGVNGDASAMLGQRRSQSYAGSLRYHLRLPTLRTRAQLQVGSVWMNRSQRPNPLDADIDGTPEGELRATRYLIPYELEDTDCQGGPCTVLGYTTGGAGALYDRTLWRNEARLDVQQILPELLGTHWLRWGGAVRHEWLTQAVRLTGGGLAYVHERDGQVYQVLDSLKSFEGIKTSDTVEGTAQLQRRQLAVEDTWGLREGLELRGGLRLDQVLLLDREAQVAELPSALSLQTGARYEFGIGQLRSTLSLSAARRVAAPPLLWLEPLYLTPERSRASTRLELSPTGTGLSLGSNPTPSSRYALDEGASLSSVQEVMAGLQQTLPAGLVLKVLGLSRTQRTALEFLAQPDGTVLLTNPAATTSGEDCFETPDGSTAAGASLCFARPTRRYSALELSLSSGQLDSDRFYLQAGYVLSQLEGSYLGPVLHSVGQEPTSLATQYAWVNQGSGSEDTNLLGALPFDRTHRFQLTLSLQLLRGLSVGAEGTLRSGMPLEALAPSADSEAGLVYLTMRGSGGRTSWVLEERAGIQFSQKVGEAGQLSLGISVLNPWVDPAEVRRDTRALLSPALPGQDSELFQVPSTESCWDGSSYTGACRLSSTYLESLETVRPRQVQVQLRYSF